MVINLDYMVVIFFAFLAVTLDCHSTFTQSLSVSQSGFRINHVISYVLDGIKECDEWYFSMKQSLIDTQFSIKVPGPAI